MIINFSAASFSAASFSAASSSTTPAAPAVNTTTPAAPVTPAPNTAGNVPATAPSGSSAQGSLSLFAQVMNQANAGQASAAPNVVANVAPETDKAANDEHKADDKTDAVPADIAAALATQADNSLPAMATPVIALPLPVPAEAAAQAQAQSQTPSQASMAQSNPALVLSMHPAAVTLNAVAAPAGRDTREPLAAANPIPSDKSSASFDSYAAQGNGRPAATPTPTPASAAPGAAATPGAPAARDGERAAEPVAASTPSQGLTGAPANGVPATDTIKLNGSAQQWQAPLREALGDRLQTQVGRNGETAVIRLDPPMLGRIDIAIRHTAGSLQVSVTASNTEVLRQLQNIGDNLRSDLAQRQYTDVSVNISATPRSPAAQAFAENDARGQRQPGRQQDDNEPGRALSDDAPDSATFAMHEREQY